MYSRCNLVPGRGPRGISLQLRAVSGPTDGSGYGRKSAGLATATATGHIGSHQILRGTAPAWQSK